MTDQVTSSPNITTELYLARLGSTTKYLEKKRKTSKNKSYVEYRTK